MASDDLRALVDAAIRQNMLFGLQDAELDGAGGTQRINEWADWISATVAALVQPELDRLTAERDAARSGREQLRAISRDHRGERDRYRAAWQSARQRAQAYGEGILRHVEDRDAYKGWMDEQAERASRAEQELAAVRAALETLTAQSAAALVKRDKAKQRARIAEAELETLRAGLREIGGDPTQVQNVYAQLSSRTRQWKAAEAALQAVREAQSLGEALAAVAKHDGLTTEEAAPGGLRGLLEHVGIDVAGRVITVDGVPIDDVGPKKPATVPGVDACYSGRHCVTWGFCRRCAPELAEEASRLFKATGGSSEAYAAIVKGLTEPTTEE